MTLARFQSDHDVSLLKGNRQHMVVEEEYMRRFSCELKAKMEKAAWILKAL